MQNLTEKQRWLISLCLQIGAERFKGHSETIAHSGVAESFAEQSAQASELATMFSGADSVTVQIED